MSSIISETMCPAWCAGHRDDEDGDEDDHVHISRFVEWTPDPVVAGESSSLAVGLEWDDHSDRFGKAPALHIEASSQSGSISLTDARRLAREISELCDLAEGKRGYGR